MTDLNWRSSGRVFLPFALGYFISYLYRTVNAVIAPDLVRDIGLEPASLGFLTSTYFLAFAAFQLPLGLLLDRFGPRRVDAGLLLIAGVGALVFAEADSMGGLILGRALIGLGVSACLMAAFKAFSVWFPADRLPLVNSVQMLSGGFGALAASTPVELALRLTDWRGLFVLLSGMTLGAAVIIFLVVPEQARTSQGETLGQQWAGLATVFSHQAFWRIAPWTVAAQAAYLSMPGLWAGPWLRDVAGYSRMAVANTLMALSLAMIAGYFSFGVLADVLARRGIRPLLVAASGMVLFMGTQLLLVLSWTALTIPLWLLFGFCGTSCILPYAVLSQSFPKHLAGRANTALNVLVFSAAFAAQWMIGAIIGHWPLSDAGGYDPTGYQAGFAVVLGLQGVAALWFLICRPKGLVQ